MWFSDERVARYNGSETTEYDSDNDTDDTVSTLSLTETSVGDFGGYISFTSDEEDSTEDEEVNGFVRFYIDRSLSFEENLRNYYNSRMLHS